jgi:hypothetical protein
MRKPPINIQNFDQNSNTLGYPGSGGGALESPKHAVTFSKRDIKKFMHMSNQLQNNAKLSNHPQITINTKANNNNNDFSIDMVNPNSVKNAGNNTP